ncbi:hypothetical protein ACFQ1L_05230 [Phytohabitans flavus]|uniref:hypothetical protein n=1 Tax=Phytohabitans flavus TaxID=1076124 RepID=UPI0036360851
MMVDGRVARGERTRTAVLDTAVALVTKDGLDGLSSASSPRRSASASPGYSRTGGPSRTSSSPPSSEPASSGPSG